MRATQLEAQNGSKLPDQTTIEKLHQTVTKHTTHRFNWVALKAGNPISQLRAGGSADKSRLKT